MSSGVLFVVSGPSGAGKTTLVMKALAELSPAYDIQKLVSYTTKLPRPEEQKGIDYHYITIEEFARRQQEGFFAEAVGFYGNYYGVAQHSIDSLYKGTSMITIINQAGGLQLQKLYPHTIGIWIDVLSIEVLAERLKLRGSENAAQREVRLNSAPMEIYQSRHSIFYKYRILNDEFDAAYHYLIDVLKKELKVS